MGGFARFGVTLMLCDFISLKCSSDGSTITRYSDTDYGEWNSGDDNESQNTGRREKQLQES